MLEAISEGPEGIVLLQHAVGIHEPVPSPWGEGQGEGGEYETLAIRYRESA